MAANQVTLKLYVDKTNNRVQFAEAGKDFIDILLSFLTLPLGTVVRLAGKQSSIHCMNKLYESVETLDDTYFDSKACQSMLLHPISNAAERCKGLKINVDDAGALRYFICKRTCICAQLSFIPGTICSHGNHLDEEANLVSYPTIDGFVKDLSDKYIVQDDMVISPTSIEAVLSLVLQRAGEQGKSKLVEKVVHVSSSDVLRLLKRCLFSKTALTDVFVADQNDGIPFPLKESSVSQRPHVALKSNPLSKIGVKLLLNKSDKSLLFAEVNQDFIDLLFSFLTYPISFLVKTFGGQSGMPCMDNLYRSTNLFGPAVFLNMTYQEILLNPSLPPCFSLRRKLVPIPEAEPQDYYKCEKTDSMSNVLHNSRYDLCGCREYRNQQLRIVNPKNYGGFLKSAPYMVTDDLVVAPLYSAIMLYNYLNDVQEGKEVVIKKVDIGHEEAIALLKATMFSSKTVLTDALLNKQEL